jgi:hypothetical protein
MALRRAALTLVAAAATLDFMGAEIPLPSDFVESLCQLRLPVRTDDRLQALMDRNTEGQLTPEERNELESLVDLSEALSLIGARALSSLGRRPLAMFRQRS